MEKKKKSIFKKWWFWVIVVVIVAGVAGAGENSKDSKKETAKTETEKESGKKDKQETEKEEVDEETSTTEPFEINLKAGYYTVGVDIPAGTYRLFVRNSEAYAGIPAYENPEDFPDVSFNATGAILYAFDN